LVRLRPNVLSKDLLTSLCSLYCGLIYRRIFERPETEINSITSTAKAAHRIEEPKKIEPTTFADFRHVRLRNRLLKFNRSSQKSPPGSSSFKVDEPIQSTVEGHESPRSEEHSGRKKRQKLALLKCRQCRAAHKKVRCKVLITSWKT
jgi:hypothetical protein